MLNCDSPITQSDMHHVPIEITLEFYIFAKAQNDKTNFSFNFKRCDFLDLNNLFLEINWDNMFHNSDTVRSFELFKTTVVDLCKQSIPLISNKSTKFPGITQP